MGPAAAGGVGGGDAEEVGRAQERHLQDGHTGSHIKTDQMRGD